ncbi:uncharacterized protein BHQ10_007396 [Talaromyces amestolkiae]|uniref:Cupin 2 conserved barrel domain-containing protein n=1 Tax=Talaromyces amestolkiae TaxID=1196081 RepID=A0A364L6F5_TALAM|nr:uncharacterized protein BHQ10_007396 [Talaromyces amestolkiae]RAO71384.1 hypothetical protein BHQ10_007396 [Talaromyces amestolkiae]
MPIESQLRDIKRYITTNNEAGESVFSSVDDNPPAVTNPTPANLFFCYATQNFPVDIKHEKDIERYQHFIDNPPGIIIPGGSAARIVDFPPDFTSAMHRTVSVNYNFVIDGEVEIMLDSGEMRLMKPGDVLVQRSVNHAWRNPSSTKWARIAAVSFPAVADGMKESGLEGVLKSE